MSAAWLVLVLTVPAWGATGVEPEPTVSDWRARVHPSLLQVWEEASQVGARDALHRAHARGLPVDEGGVRVVVETSGGLPQGGWGVRVRARYGSLVECVVMPQALPALAAQAPVRWIRPPVKPIPCVVSEGVSLTGAAAWHSHGFVGAGAEVAVIDVGFQSLGAAMAAGELPSDVVTVDFTGYGMESLGKHGTAVAEVVHDMAPGARLTLINTYGEVDLGNAKDYCVAHGIKVINHSVGYANTGGGDGTGVVCEIANDAAAHGILWVNAAGNHALNHYRAFFVDTDGDSLHEFAPGMELNSLGVLSPGQTVWVYLNWDAWPLTDQDFDLFLWRRDGSQWEQAACSRVRQTGSQPPTEEIGFSVSASGEHAVSIQAYQVTQPHRVTLLSAYHRLAFATPAGSLLQPADASGALAVGAIARQNWTTGPQEVTSSQGPTTDGRMKPDVAGPDRVSSWVAGSSFTGTSAASPHVAGAAALVWGAFPQWTVAQVWECLVTHAIDMGPQGQDSLYGWGRLDLPLSIGAHPATPRAWVQVWATPNPFWESTTVHFRGMDPVGSIQVFDVAGRRVRRVRLEPGAGGRWVWRGEDDAGSQLPPGVYYVTLGSVPALPVVIQR